MGITIIAEGGINSNGSLEIAKKMMTMAKECGVDFIKWQKRTLNVVYSTTELDKPRESPWGTTTREQKHGLEFTRTDYDEIDRYSKYIALPWFASAWDLGSLQFLDKYDLPCHKIASPMITNLEFCEEVAKRKKLTYISTGGLPDLCMVHKVVNIFKYRDCPIVLMHCVLEYPCPPENTNLSMIRTLGKEFPGIPIGFSSHAVSPIIGFAAALMGARAIETHITLDRSMYGSDQSASLEKSGLEKLVDYCKIASLVHGDGVKKITDKEKANAAKLRYWEGA